MENTSTTTTIYKDERLDNNALYFYYSKVFPIELMVEWLSYQKSSNAGHKALSRREFSLSLPADDGGEIYMRWLCFPTTDSWKGKLTSSTPFPHKMDIGALYSLPLSMKEVQPHRFKPLEKEVVFDIDMNDYDEIRTCCGGKTVCDKCWRFMTLAMKILDDAFRMDYGFKNILWVYSGRRGIHAWICDLSARRMNNSARIAMVNYLNVVNERAHDGLQVKLFKRIPGDSNNLNVEVSYLDHPLLQRARKYCCDSWPMILSEQNLFNGSGEKAIANRTKLKEHLGSAVNNYYTEILSKVECYKDTSEYSTNLWAEFEKISQLKDYKKLRPLLEEIIVMFTYPRLDVNVTKDVGHLLKSPFCAHPATGRICVPINPLLDGIDGRDTFRPAGVPTIAALQEEYRKTGETKLKQYVDYFKTNFLELL